VHNNYYFLRQVTRALTGRLTGSMVSQCFSQHADELILQFETPAGPYFIRATLQPDFCCLAFPADFKRARKNSIDLFQEVIGCRVVSVRPFLNDRSFSLELDRGHSLIFKMHGHRANIILLNGLTPTKIFRNHLVQDFHLSPDALNKPIDFSKEAFVTNQQNLERCYFTFGKPVWAYLTSLGFYSKSIDEKWLLFTQLLTQLEDPTYHLLHDQDGVGFSLLPGKEILKSFTDPLTAVTEFFTLHNATAAYRSEKKQAVKALQTRIDHADGYIQRNTVKLNEIESDNRFSIWADLLMANLTNITGGVEVVELPNFYNNNLPERIRLKKELSIQKNAAIYYRKAKNRELEIKKLTEGIAAKKQQAEIFKNQLAELERAHSLQDIRQLTKKFGLNREEKEKKVSLPYREVDYCGFKIRVGKNAQSNDELTQKFSYKDDLWLHAKDVSGSHVVIKSQAGKPFPKPVIERAAQLAAWYSKRKTDSLCPVTVTQRKYVRKRKGDPPGTVVVEREEVLLVEPKP
jgi:predicted ribosome quality control (RQC) complex YloA/Tae2 family protein